MPKLNDTQRILLASAAQRDDQSLLPLPSSLTAGERVTKAIAGLIGAAFATERETIDRGAVHRSDGDTGYGVFATEIGLAAIGVTDGAGQAPSATQPTAEPTPARQSKSTAVVALLEREGGATLAELITATGWLPHTTRAALTGLRKKGHAIERSKRDDQTCYRIVGAAA